jgi:hypothetical protein
MGSRLVFTLGSILLAGCASHSADFQPPPDHPANPAAAEALLPPPSGTLALAPMAAGEAAPGSQDAIPEQGSPDAGHSHHGSVPSADGDAATTTSSAPVGVAATKTIYVCPMHKQVQSDKPGKCPICKMTLKPKQVPAGAAPASQPASRPSTSQDGGADHAHHEHGGNK